MSSDPCTPSAAQTPAMAPARTAPAPAPAPRAKSDVLTCMVLTASDSRTMQTDQGGAYAAYALQQAGYRLFDRRIVVDEVSAIRDAVLEAVELQGLDALVVTGGTAISLRDVTPEAVLPLFGKQLPGFGEALRRLAWEALGPRALLTRAAAGVIAKTLVVLLPGAPQVVRLAMDALVLPILPEACGQLRGDGIDDAAAAKI